MKRRGGQALIVVMLALPLFFSVCALVVDGTNLMVNKRQAQNAVDASSLAAAQAAAPAVGAAEACAPADAACRAAVRATYSPAVAAAASDYSGQNGGPSTIHECADDADSDCWVWPYNGTFRLVQVRMKRDVSGFFASLTGIKDFFGVKAKAVASTAPITSTTVDPDDIDPGSPGYTIPGATHTTTDPDTTIPGTPGTGTFAYAMSQSCNAITITGSGHDFTAGALWSNGGISANNTNYAEYYRFGQNANCADGTGFQVSPTNTTHPPPTYVPTRAANDWPVPLPNVPSICVGGAYISGSITINAAWVTAHPTKGVYCYTGTITIQVSFSGYGFVTTDNHSNSIKSTTDGLTVTGTSEVLFYSVNGGIALTPGNGINLNGNMFAPAGAIVITGKNNVNTGFAEAQTITINNNGTTWHGTGPGQGTGPDTIVPGATHTTTDPDVVVPSTPGHTYPGGTHTQTTGTTYGIDE